MRRTSSSVLRDLEIRVARLERKASSALSRLPNVQIVDFSPAGSGQYTQFVRSRDVASFDMSRNSIQLLIQNLEMGDRGESKIAVGSLQEALDEGYDVLLLNVDKMSSSDQKFLKNVTTQNRTTTFYISF